MSVAAARSSFQAGAAADVTSVASLFAVAFAVLAVLETLQRRYKRYRRYSNVTTVANATATLPRRCRRSFGDGKLPSESFEQC